MDDGKEIGKDLQEGRASNLVEGEVEGDDLPLTVPAEEPISLGENVKMQTEGPDNKDIELPLPIDRPGSVEPPSSKKASDDSIDAHTNVDADASTSCVANVEVDATMDANADPSPNDHANIEVDATLDADADPSPNDHANIEVDANIDANANINGDASTEAVDSDSDAKIEANIDVSVVTKMECDVDVKLDADANITGEANFDVDANPKRDGNSKIDVDADVHASGQHGTNLANESIVDPPSQLKSEVPHEINLRAEAGGNDKGEKVKHGESVTELLPNEAVKVEVSKSELDTGHIVDSKGLKQSFLWDPLVDEGSESGTEEDQGEFMKELENFFRERNMEFKPPKFYGEGLNCLKLWRAVTRLGGYDQVTSCKLWRQVGESFKPPKTCTTVSWTFRCFYEKALLEYEKHKLHGGELSLPDASFTEPPSIGNQAGVNTGSGRARRDAAARAMQGWHSQRLLGNGEVGDPIIKDKNSSSTPKREKQLKNIGLLKRKKSSSVDRVVKVARMKATKPQVDTMVVDIGPPADWVKVNVRRTKDCFEVYALVPGLLREEVRVQSDPAGRLVISGQPEQLDNPWGVTPFKKVVSLPSRIDPHQTSAVVTLHGQLFVRVPFEQSDL